MAIQESTPPASTSPSSANSEAENRPSVEKQLAILQEKFAALEKRFSHLHEKENTTTEDAVGKAPDISVAPAIAGGAVQESTNLEGKDIGPKSRAKIVINNYNPDTGERKDQPAETIPEASKVEEKSHGFLLRKIVDHNRQDDNSGEIEILNRDLWDLLKRLLSHCPVHTYQGDPVEIYSPYESIVLNWEKLENAAKERVPDEKGIRARSDLQLLLDTISSSSGDAKLDRYPKTRQSNKEQRTVTFESLWTLLPPGILICGKPFLGQDQILLVQDNDQPWPSRNDSKWILYCRAYDWSGSRFKRSFVQVEFERFEGQKPITSLPFYPLRDHRDSESLKKDLIERGRLYEEICNARQGSRMFDYKGEVIVGKKGFSGITGDEKLVSLLSSPGYINVDIGIQDNNISGWSNGSESRGSRNFVQDPNEAAGKPTDVDSRVMVDFESYFRYGPGVADFGPQLRSAAIDECMCMECQDNTALQMNYRALFDKDEYQREWTEEQYLLCPPRVLGYVLRDKQWAQLQVKALKDIPKEDPNRSWERVKLADGEETKEMILNLVKGHGTADDESGLEVDDIVAKKGKVLVILLYGPPGVGKTSTAETVAIAACKPLFSISVADTGTNANKVEDNLAKLFALATSWQAILLIDEADVFLEERGKGSRSTTERNALVSVFLRVLEYYQGILMLTTNQIAQFDVAVQSRIHIAIKYTQLTRQQTMDIFEGFLRPLANKNRMKDMEDIMRWIKEDICKVGLDGRQIRNVLTSALGLARAKGNSRLEMRDIKDVLNNVKDYKDDFLRQYEKYKLGQDGMVGR